MAQNSTKKRTAVVATATAAALLLTGTFAWTLATDDTVLNAFSDTDKGDYNAEIVEKFDPENPWTEKVVTVKNTADNPVIVRVRFEEFYDLTSRVGSEYDVPEGYLENTEGASAIFYKDGKSTLTGASADSSTNLDTAITLNFGTGVVTMDEYNTLTDKSNVEWVIDEDGWCYYTKALLAGETTENLLERVDFDETNFNYNQPYDLNYKINVRLQAISADLEDFGSHVNDMQWTNTDYVNDEGTTVTDTATTGRVITADDRADNYEILSDSTITGNALDLVINVKNTYNNKYANADGSIAVEVSTYEELTAAINDSSVHSILLTNDIRFADDNFNSFTVDRNLLIELGEYVINRQYTGETQNYPLAPLFTVTESGNLSVKHGKIYNNGLSLSTYEMAPLIDNYGSLELVGITKATSYAESVWAHSNSTVKIYNSYLQAYYAACIKLPMSEDGQNILINNSTLYTQDSCFYVENLIEGGDPASDVNLVIENNSKLYSGVSGVVTGPGWDVRITDSLISASLKNSNSTHEAVALSENYHFPADSIYIENSTLNSIMVGVYKVSPSPLTMKNCTINAVANGDNRAQGIFIRAGKVNLDGVDVNVSCGSGGINNTTGPYYTYDAYSNVKNTYDTIDDFYKSKMGASMENYEALMIDLNSYDNIDLTINDCQFKTDSENIEGGAKSVFIFDADGTQPLGALEGVTFDNHITLTGNNTFTPATDAFDQNYNFTTITK